MITCYAIDDEEYALSALVKHIEKVTHLKLIGSSTSPLQALKEIDFGPKPDLVFLDIDMPELSGLTLADLLPPTTAIIFTTGHAKYALNGFEKGIEDFLLKPFSFEQFLKSITKVKTRLRKENPPLTSEESFFINPGVKGKMVQINSAEITHIEALDHAICIYTITEKHITKLSMKEVQEKFAALQMTRVHRSFMVKISQIKSIDHQHILLQNHIRVPLGDAYRPSLMQLVKQKMLKEL